MTIVSPLRDGAKRGVVVGAEDQSQPWTPLPPISEPISVSIMLPIPPKDASATPRWLEGEVTKQMKAATISLKARVDGYVEEVWREILENGDAESWWAARMIPR